jgi:hypothetical protein
MRNISSCSFFVKSDNIINTSASVLIKAITFSPSICTHIIGFTAIYKNLNFELIYLRMQSSSILILTLILLNWVVIDLSALIFKLIKISNIIFRSSANKLKASIYIIMIICYIIFFIKFIESVCFANIFFKFILNIFFLVVFTEIIDCIMIASFINSSLSTVAFLISDF